MSKSSSITPLMQQHNAIKQKYPDAILLFRVGDFYETFGEDAVRAAQTLGITLTKRNNSDEESSQLAGFPHHALDTYLHKLVKAGYRVAICDQLEDPKLAKGIVKRGVTEVVTPGIATNDKLLEHDSNNFLSAVYLHEDNFGIAFLDISTGEFLAAEGNPEFIEKLIQSFKPSEIIFQKGFQKTFKELFGSKHFTYQLEEWIFDQAYCIEILLKHFQTHSLKGFGIDNFSSGVIAAGVIIHYLKETEHHFLQHIVSIQRIEKDGFLWMDKFTMRNLELFSNHVHESKGLIEILDNTISPMGARLLKRWITFPLNQLQSINERLDSVEYLIRNKDLAQVIFFSLKQVGDIERLASKIPNKKINPRELLQLSKSLYQTEIIREALLTGEDKYLKRLADAINPCKVLYERILKEIQEQPPLQLNKGEVIKKGVSPTLDELRNLLTNSKNFLNELLESEQMNTQISSLKLGFNNVFGYYLEVTNTHKNKVPDHWMRKQTLANAERYVTPELKSYEEKILGAEEKIMIEETELYEKILISLQDYVAPLLMNGNLLAIIDCLWTFSSNAQKYNYHRPELHEGFLMDLKESRHPVIERCLPNGEVFVSNDIFLDPESQQIIILTGPNMSGKSALLRQTALITLLAHTGSFVPAQRALIPLTDKIFTRVGANDNLSGGESTFMVEMNETASIINNISARSLILLDEIGRGTSTYDGISLAWSIVEYLNHSSHKPKTLFATHYHELNELENRLEGIKNYHVSHVEIGNKIIFLRKLTQGGSTHSFGIHVAKLAGMPPKITDRANELLKHLEKKQIEVSSEASTETNAIKKTANIQNMLKSVSQPQLQLSIFDVHSETFAAIRNILENIDINRLTPVEALLKLQEIKMKIK